MYHFIPAGMEWAISFQPEWNGPFHSGQNGMAHFILAGMEWPIPFPGLQKDRYRGTGGTKEGFSSIGRFRKFHQKLYIMDQFLGNSKILNSKLSQTRLFFAQKYP